MESEFVREYIGCMCKIDLDNGYYYKGRILSVGEDSLVMIDKNNKRIMLSLRIINEIREVEE